MLTERRTLASIAGDFHERTWTCQRSNPFSAVWINRLPPGDPIPLVVTPDATADLQWVGGRLRVAGPDTEPIAETMERTEPIIGFRFRHGMAAKWLGVPLGSFTNKRVLLEDVWGSSVSEIEYRAQNAKNADQLVGVLEKWVADTSPRSPLQFGSMGVAFGLVAEGPPKGQELIPWLVDRLGVSERTLRRQFIDTFGLGPKTLHRICRFDQYLKLLQQTTEPDALLALWVGFSDQSHLNREVRRLSGATPGQLRSLLSRRPPDLPRRKADASSSLLAEMSNTSATGRDNFRPATVRRAQKWNQGLVF